MYIQYNIINTITSMYIYIYIYICLEIRGIDPSGFLFRLVRYPRTEGSPEFLKPGILTARMFTM